MARDFFINGESLVSVKGNPSTIFPSITQLGLAVDAIRVTPEFRYKEILIDAWGEVPVDVQFMLAAVNITINLEHIDRVLLDAVIQESMGGSTAVGLLTRAGTRLGGNNPRLSAGWHYVGLNIYSPVGNKPWNFLNCYLSSPPVEIPLGTEKSVFRTNWRCIPYVQDPANIQGGIILGATNVPLWTHILDT